MKKIATFARDSSKRTKILMVSGMLALSSILVGTVVYAAVPDSNGVITACYRNGLLPRTRIIDTAETSNCNAGEAKVTWNQQGPKGDPGPQGPAGPAGGTSNVGKRLQLNWGDIANGGTPQLLTSIPGYGDIHITKCDSGGAFNFTFTNTSGETLYYQDGTNEYVIGSGNTVDNDSGNFPYIIATGSGANSKATQFGINPIISADNQTCVFYAIVI